MPEVQITIGGRAFEVACQDGEQPFLEAAAKLLDAEAQVLSGQLGRMPEGRMLLMAGLMLADKAAGMEEQIAQLREEAAAAQAMAEELQARPAPPPQKVEVPVIPAAVTDGLAELAARAEALADEMEDAEG